MITVKFVDSFGNIAPLNTDRIFIQKLNGKIQPNIQPNIKIEGSSFSIYICNKNAIVMEGNKTTGYFKIKSLNGSSATIDLITLNSNKNVVKKSCYVKPNEAFEFNMDDVNNNSIWKIQVDTTVYDYSRLTPNPTENSNIEIDSINIIGNTPNPTENFNIEIGSINIIGNTSNISIILEELSKLTKKFNNIKISSINIK